MKTSRRIVLFCALVALVAGGCGLGYNRLLFFTTTNFGLNVDGTPPTAEINIARREGVIAPAFDGDKSPPVLGMFKSVGGIYNPSLSGVFAGGQAAELVAEPVVTGVQSPTPTGQPVATPTPEPYCVSDPPSSAVLDALGAIPYVGAAFSEQNDRARPFFFATDTMTGIKVAWTGTGGAYPDQLKFGYNRKEFAYAPVFGEPSASGTPTPGGVLAREAAAPATVTPPCSEGKKRVSMPSFLATIIDGADASQPANLRLNYVQFFATGRAADRLAKRDDVRAMVANQMLAPAVGTATHTAQATPTITSTPVSTPTATP